MMISRLIALSCALAMVSIGGIAFGDDSTSLVEQAYTFDKPTVQEIKVGGATYTTLVMPGCPNGGNEGDPLLPATGASILLPPTCEARTIKVVCEAPISLGTGHKVVPAGRSYPLSQPPRQSTPPSPNHAVYGSEGPFPAGHFVSAGTHDFRGFRILTLRLHPVQYVPATGELLYYPKLTVQVDTSDTGKFLPGYIGLESDRREVYTKVDNPGMVDAYSSPLASIDDPLYDMMILTVPEFVSVFQPLADYHTNRGITTVIHTTDDIGSTDPDSIRAYFQQRRFGDGFSYVLIGADDDIIPAKNLFVQAYPGEVEMQMPGDIYYACLGGTWDHDGDGRYGEPGDGIGGSNVDLVADIYIGRAPVGDPVEVARFVDKTLWYLNDNHQHLENALLVGEYLGFSGPSEYAADTLDELVDTCSTHGQVTDGLPSDLYVVDKLYDKTWPGNDWPRNELASRLNDDGFHIVNHLGHGLPEYAMKFNSLQVFDEWLNPDLCFVYSQTCLAGHFDDTDCWAEYVTVKSDYAAFAAIMNARYGFGQENSTDGPSQRFNRQFWDAMYGEQIRQIGRAHHDCKEDNLYRIDEECMRWCYYEMNLFGDPTIVLKGGNGLRVAPRAGLTAEGPAGGPFTPAQRQYVLNNMGDAAIDYSVTVSEPWLSVTNGTGSIPAYGTAQVVVSIGGEAESLSDGRYTDVISFVNLTDHVGDATHPVVLDVGEPAVAYEWSLNIDPGWTTEGQWAFGVPTGAGGEHGSPDPTSGQTGLQVYGYNLNGDYANGMTVPEYLTTTAIDCTGLDAVRLQYWQWLGVESAEFDHAAVQVSTDGQAWTTVWENDQTMDGGAWEAMDLDISSIADNQPTVYVRWSMGTTDGGWAYCGWNIDDITIVALGVELPPLMMALPQGVPAYMSPGPARPIDVHILAGNESYVAGSATLHYRWDDGPFGSTPLVHVEGDTYRAMLSPPSCEAMPEYYFSAEGDAGSIVLEPAQAPGVVFTAAVGSVATILSDNFEDDLGWTVQGDASDGQWDRGVPVGCDRGDPASDYDGSGQCFLTDNSSSSECNSDVDDGSTRLISPRIELSGEDAEVHFALWYTNDAGADPYNDEFLIYVSDDDGDTWTVVEVVGPVSASGWSVHSFVVGDFVTPTDYVRVAFEAADLDEGAVVEAGVDAFRVERFACVPRGSGDFDQDGDVDLLDFARFQTCFGQASPECMAGDLVGDGSVHLEDAALMIDQISAW